MLAQVFHTTAALYFIHKPHSPASTGPQCCHLVMYIVLRCCSCDSQRKLLSQQSPVSKNSYIHSSYHVLASTSSSVCQVDCAYYSDDLLEVNLDPGRDLKELLEARGLQGLEASCPQCYQNQRKLVRTACSIYIHALVLQHLCMCMSACISAAQPSLGTAQPHLPPQPSLFTHQAKATGTFGNRDEYIAQFLCR